MKRITMILAVGIAAAAVGAAPEDGLLLRFDAAARDTVETSDLDRQPRLLPASESGQRAMWFFDGVDDVVRVPLGVTVDTWTLVAVVSVERPVGGGGIASGAPDGRSDYDPGFTVDCYGASQAWDQISVEGAGRIGGQRDQMERSHPTGGLHVIAVVRADDRVDLYVDGVFEGARPVTPATTVIDTFRIGARYYDGQERLYFHGGITQVLFYGRALEAEEREAIEAELAVSDEERSAGEARALVAKSKPDTSAPEVMASWPTVAAFVKAEGPALDPATLPIRTDLREAIELSSIHLNSLFDADRDNEPYFFVNREADGTGKMRHSVEIGIPHVVGRCLLGSRMAEKYAEVPFPEPGFEILERYCRASFDNPDHLNSYVKDGGRFVEFHNMREGLYGLWALIDRGGSPWAADTAHDMLETLDRITDSEGNWSPALAKEAGMDGRCFGLSPPNAGRMVDPLLAYYDATKDPLAMKLAGLYTKRAMAALFEDDGRFKPMDSSSGHVHSITSSLSGFTDYAVRTQDEALLARCRAVMDVGVPEYFSSWGWGDEVFPEHPANVVGRGEMNQTGDVVRTALILGEAGYPQYFETAERFLRSMLLPTQHRAAELKSILRDKAEPADDSERNTVARSVGGYAMQLPNDRMRKGDWPISTLDITSGAVHGMSECYRVRTTVREGVYRVNLLFDFDDDHLHLTSSLPTAGAIAARAKDAVSGLAIRIPEWVEVDTVSVAINGNTVERSVSGGYLNIGRLRSGDGVSVNFPLPVRVEKEMVDGTAYTTTWVGNQILAIEPRGSESALPF